jgi:hypothetical protein
MAKVAFRSAKGGFRTEKHKRKRNALSRSERQLWENHTMKTKRMLRRLQSIVACWVLVLTAIATAQDKSSSIIGRWDVTVHGADGDYPSWFEVQRSGRKSLVGSYVGQFGSARPVSKVEFENDTMRFTVPPQWEERATDVTYEGKLKGDTIRGETTGDKGERIRWEARRAPSLDRKPTNSWSTPIELFNGRDLTGWKTQLSNRKNGWLVKDGILVNAEPGNNLMTEQKFNDFKIHVEFRYPKGSNSGLFLRGRYEVQIEDNSGQETDSHRIGGVYGFLTPSFNAAKPAGEWQTLDVTFVGRHVTVVLNDERIIDRQSIPGITGGALYSHEEKSGPILIQGDHGPVEFRKLTITPMLEGPLK